MSRTPVRVYANGGEPVVEWALVDGPFADPFFEQTANRAMQKRAGSRAGALHLQHVALRLDGDLADALWQFGDPAFQQYANYHDGSYMFYARITGPDGASP